ncbi:MAG: DUF1847 domain-containing protein [Desulfocapsaceae bacterium]|nr:DUF1847 domain-containing protein [Desulfocapsaceae bacterium]
MNNNHPNCAACSFQLSVRACKNKDGKYPPNCPTVTDEEVNATVLKEYASEPVTNFARQASLQEEAGYGNKEQGYARLRPLKPRIEEIFDFIARMNYRRIGMAFCIGLRKEAGMVEKLFSAKSLELVSVICKVGRVSKEELGITDRDKIVPGSFESMCNPILQAETLNREETEFNILLGLCVGHDSLFFQYAKAPCTVLAVKDRVTGHNPLAAVYTLDSYYRSLK